MAVLTPIDRAELEFDNGSFDAAGFAAQALGSRAALAALIDHTQPAPAATRAQVEALCDEAIRYRFGAVTVSPIWVAAAVARLSETGIAVAAVLGFPHGGSLVSTVRHEAAALARLGARELEVVIPIGQLKSGNHPAVHHTVQAAAEVAHRHGVLLKVTLETALLTMAEKLRAAETAIQAGADWIATSTGFVAGGATVADVALMRGVAGARCGVKAVGGIQTLAEVKAVLEAGADRIGTTASVAIIRELGAG